MHVAVCRLTLRLHGNNSLKGKRRIVRSLCDRLRSRFSIAVAEVEEQDLLRTAIVGLVAVSGDRRHASDILTTAVNFAHGVLSEAEITDTDIDVITYE
jgi:uncharacterized protein